MYLSKLEVVGFKSFANKINLQFDSGITAIVGPNGCGKTNVVDAIRWALGEQRPTTLRSDKMEDVIFNGTKNRKPVGMADVSLTIENTKGILPIEYSEVTITRRVYRSGESEYYLNKTLCRLRDIKDLFMDTGMGSDAYSVIELKMVETILSDRTEERRRLFEEAAGVTKYKHRRKEAFRRLESVQQDLVRVNDVVKEVQKAVNSLERQATRAERYNEMTKQYREIEIGILEREFSSVHHAIGPLTQELADAKNDKIRIDSDLSREEEQLDILRRNLQSLEEQLTETQGDLSELQQQINLAQQKKITSVERKKSLAGAAARFEKDKIDLRQQQQELDHRSRELRSLIERTHVKVDETAKDYTEKKESLDAVGSQLELKKGEVRSLQEKIVESLHALSEKRQEQERIKARIENIRGRIDFSSEENSLYQDEVSKDSGLVQQLSVEDKELRKLHAEAEVRVIQMEQYKRSIVTEIDTLRNNEFELRSAIDRRRSRRDFLKSLIESYDGYSEGAKFLFESDEWKPFPNNTVGDSLTTTPELRIAVESALGETLGFIVVEEANDAYRGIDFLKKKQKGKATFICLDRLPVIEQDSSMIAGDGVIGWARKMITCDNRYSQLFNFLFDKTLIVRDVAAAAQCVSSAASVKCATLDGEIVTSEGFLKGGSTRSDEGGHIGKQNQIDELEKEVSGLETDLWNVRRKMEESEANLTRVDVKNLTEKAKEIEQRKTSVEMKIAQTEYEKKRILENIQRNSTESIRLAEEGSTLQAELDRLLPEIERMENQKSSVEQQSGAAHSELETLEVMWSEFSTIANNVHVALLNLENEEKNYARELEYTKATVTNIVSTLSQRDHEITQANEESARIDKELVIQEEQVHQLSKRLAVMIETKKTVDSEFNTKRNAMHSIELKLKDERRLHDESLGRTHTIEMRLAEMTMKRQTLETRAREEFGLLIDVKVYIVDDPYDIELARDSARELKEKIASLGPVNFAAFEEFTAEKDRLEFINNQKNDLIEAEKTLMATIEEINTTAKNTFNETFMKIRENFIATFKSLFDEGDECDLRLEEGVDPLEARIEIIAKPRGKRPTSIDLLSGGEKTLTAIALLFAIYLVKPSPFCILDEVDAPLDDSNIDRFSRIIRKFSDNTQFIVVTHNKRTMEAANAMYGVTMEEEGVSKLVSVRFNENKISKN